MQRLVELEFFTKVVKVDMEILAQLQCDTVSSRLWQSLLEVYVISIWFQGKDVVSSVVTVGTSIVFSLPEAVGVLADALTIFKVRMILIYLSTCSDFFYSTNLS